MRIAGVEPRPGEIVRTLLPVIQGASPVKIPVWIAQGRHPGRTMLLTAALHGDEINAITVVQHFVKQLDLDELRGQLLILPVVNVNGFRVGDRHVPEDGKDLNRCFPGNPNGSVAEQMADVIFSEIVPKADLGVDVHDSGKGSVLLPHPRVLHTETAEIMDLAAAFGTEIIMVSELPPGYEGVMPIEARERYGMPFITVEVGGGTILWETLIEQGVAGLRNVLTYAEMLPGYLVLPEQQFFVPGRDDLAVRAPIGGILTQHVDLGAGVTAGEPLVTIESPLTLERSVIQASGCGVVHDLNVHGKVNEGDDVVGVMEFSACDGGCIEPCLEEIATRVNEPTDQVRIRECAILKKVIRLLA